MTEKALQNAILRAFGTLPALRLWRANVGVARLGRRVVRFGIPGQGDLTGILPDGRRLEIEVKAAAGRQTSAQRSFQEMIERFHGVYILAKSVEDVRQRLIAAGVRLG
ncbi:MAG: VRR-NUC domain-containing protein [Planctomycetota bacterium]